MAAKEQWRPIVGYEGLYTINNLGVIKNAKGKVLKYAQTKDGYFRVILSKNNKQHHYLVHRLVAIAFIPNLQNLPIINHKDENKQNNSVDNLEWCTCQYNVTYNKTEFNGRFERQAVLQYDLQGNLIAEFVSLREAERQTGIPACHIALNCKGSTKYKHAGKYIWKYKNDKTPVKLLPKIIQLSLDDKVINTFNSVKEAAEQLNILNTSILNCIAGRSKRAGNFKWERR